VFLPEREEKEKTMILKVKSKVTLEILGTNVEAVVVDHGQALITQEGFLSLLLGPDDMRDADLAGGWRRLLFFNPQTRFRAAGVVFEDESGEEGIGYNISDVVRGLYEFSEDARQQSGPVVKLGERVRDVVARLATLALYINIEQLSGTRVSMIGII
jgi:hypothetical protein